MTTSRNISNDLLERELAGLTAGEPHEPGLWAAALDRSGSSPRAGSVLTRTVPVWATGTLLGLIVMTVLVSLALNARVGAKRPESPTNMVLNRGVQYHELSVTGDRSTNSALHLGRDLAPSSARPNDPAMWRSVPNFESDDKVLASVSGGRSLQEQPSSDAGNVIPPDRQVIRKAQIDIRTSDNVRIVFMKAQQVISEAGGEYIENAALTGEGDRTVATVTLRVAAARLSEVLNRLRELGVVASESASGEDVTDRVVDLEARLRNEQRIESEMLELLESRKDASLEEILQLRTQLANVRERIEQFTAQRDRLGRLVALATILVSIQPAAAPPVAEEPAKFSISAYFSDSIARSWNTSLRVLVDTAAFFVRLFVGGIVWWILLLTLVLGLRAAWRSHRRAAAAEPAPTA